MKAPIYVRALSPVEQAGREAGLRSSNAFTLRRSQILLASSRGQRPKEIARNLGCATQTVRNALHAFEQKGLDCLKQESSRPKTVQAQFDQAKCEALRSLLHQSPRTFVSFEPILFAFDENLFQVSMRIQLECGRLTNMSVAAHIKLHIPVFGDLYAKPDVLPARASDWVEKVAFPLSVEWDSILDCAEILPPVVPLHVLEPNVVTDVVFDSLSHVESPTYILQENDT